MLKRLSLTTFVTLFVGIAFGQNTANSPFSSYGLGEFGNVNNAQFAALGNITSLSTDTTVLNPYNPSTYSLLSEGIPLFGVGFSSKISFFKDNGGQQTSFNSNITNFSLAVPFGKRFGVAGGLMPYSRRGYNIYLRNYAYDDSITHQYQGFGAINNVFVGFSYAPIKNQRTELSIGAQLNYLFGSVSNVRYSYFDSPTSYSGVQIDSKRVKSVAYTLGLTFRQYLDIERKKELVIGAVVSPQVNLSGNLDYGLYSALDVTNYPTYDTIEEVSDNKGKITMPMRQVYSVGYSFKPRTTENFVNSIYSLGVYGEFEVMQWQNYRETFDNYTYTGLTNTFSARLALQFQPNTDIQTKSKGVSYFNKVKYRAGAFYMQNPIVYNTNQFATMGVTLGFGFPFIAQKSNSSLNFSVQYGKTSNGNSSDLNERFLTFSLGIIIAPSNYERWFRKYNVD